MKHPRRIAAAILPVLVFLSSFSMCLPMAGAAAVDPDKPDFRFRSISYKQDGNNLYPSAVVDNAGADYCLSENSDWPLTINISGDYGYTWGSSTQRCFFHSLPGTGTNYPDGYAFSFSPIELARADISSATFTAYIDHDNVINESDKNNNSTTTVVYLQNSAANLPDFIITDVKLLHADAANTYFYQVTVKNQGQSVRYAAVKPLKLTLNAGDVSTTTSIYGDNSGLYFPGGFTKTVNLGPQDFSAQNHTVSAYAIVNKDESMNTVMEESDPNNNSFWKNLDVPNDSSLAPDFRITNLDLRPDEKGVNSYYATIENIGAGASATSSSAGIGEMTNPLYIELTASEAVCQSAQGGTGQPPCPNNQLDYFTTGMMEKFYPAGFKKEFKVGEQRSKPVNSSQIYVTAKADKYNFYWEKNEENNTAQKTVSISASKTDFTVKNMRVLKYGSNAKQNIYEVRATLANNSGSEVSGKDSAGKSIPLSMGLYEVKGTSSKLLASKNVTIAKFPKNYSKEIAIGRFSASKAESYFTKTIKVAADIADRYKESDEKNNSASKILYITKADLRVQSVLFANKDSSGAAGNYLKVVFKNFGITPNQLSNSKIPINISAKFTNRAGKNFGSAQSATTQLSGKELGTVYLPVPKNLASGQLYRAKVKVDSNASVNPIFEVDNLDVGTIIETSDSNNTKQTPWTRYTAVLGKKIKK